MSNLSFHEQRLRLVDEELKSAGLTNERVLSALRSVPRELFVSAEVRDRAYENRPQPIECSQTISQPLIVAIMTAALELPLAGRVLEIGTGSGYAAAVLAEVAAEVFTIERHQQLADQAFERLKAAGYLNVRVRHGDGTLGWPEEAPFDGIVVTAAGPRVPDALKRQLKIDGHLVMPVGDEGDSQSLIRVTRTGVSEFKEVDLGAVRFVPLIGKNAWP